MVFLGGSQSVHTFFNHLFVYTCTAVGDPFIMRGKGGGGGGVVGIALTDLTTHCFFPVPNLGMDFERLISWSVSIFNDLRGEVILLFIDIWGIVDYYCLNFFL